MKKTYVKPMIVFEDFKISSSIAAGCTYTTQHAENVCAYDFGGVVIFLSNMGECTASGAFIPESTPGVDVNDTVFGVCYHNPANSNLFDS